MCILYKLKVHSSLEYVSPVKSEPLAPAGKPAKAVKPTRVLSQMFSLHPAISIGPQALPYLGNNNTARVGTLPP